MMSVEIWSTVGTILGTLVFLIVPGLVYSWYALEHIRETPKTDR